MPYFKMYNGAMVTTAALAPVTTGTSIKTMLQVGIPSSSQLIVVSWGYTCDNPPSTTNTGQVELLQTDVGATVTAAVAAGVQPLNPGSVASRMTLSTAATGYTATVEGATAATRTFDQTRVTGVSNGSINTSYFYQFMPDERPTLAASSFLRIRVTFAAAVNMICWVTWQE